MPIFEYRCSSCDEVFEELVLSRNREAVACPQCGQTKVEQLLSVFAPQTGSRGSSSFGECYNRSAGICEAGGGPMT